MKQPYSLYSRLSYSYSLLSLSYLIILVIFLQGPIHAVAQSNQYESVFAPNNKIRSSSITSLGLNDDNTVNNDDEGIYDDDNEKDFEGSSSSTKSPSQVKVTSKVTSSFPAQAEELQKDDYGDEAEAYSNDLNDDETTNQDEPQVFPDTIPIKATDIKPDINTFDNKKILDYSTTSRIPFLTANLWRDLFSKPGILVGIIGGIVIGMLSAILLVMFIIYRMRKKDEGSYALEEGPRKSPSHAYTRVSSREFFA